MLMASNSTFFGTLFKNHTIPNNGSLHHEYIFDRTNVRIIFIFLYGAVFCCCFCGNLLVILVVVMSRRLRSITNFFLANLALADFCVGVFCVLQNLSIYLIESWVFGEFFCKMYQFVHALSYTASIFILMVICMERYFAIIYPITCKQILTSTRLRLAILGVWLASAIYSIPKFIFSRTITNIHMNGINEEICIMHRKLFNSKILDCVNFVALYVLPLLLMTTLYSRIAIVLWKSFAGLERHCFIRHPAMVPLKPTDNNYLKSKLKKEKKSFRISTYQTSSEINSASSNHLLDKTTSTRSRLHSTHFSHRHNNSQFYQISTNNVLLARRGVIRMLIVVVFAFSICNLPLHARKMWQYWSDNYKGSSNFTAVLTPLTFLISYLNSAINPLLYAFMSKNFRKGFRELFCRSERRIIICGEPYQMKPSTLQIQATSDAYSDSLPVSGCSITIRAPQHSSIGAEIETTVVNHNTF